MEYHRHLIPKNKKDNDVQGGFNLEIDHDSRTVTLYGQSGDFGRIDPVWLHSKLKDEEFRKDIIDQLYWYHINISPDYKFIFRGISY